MITILGRERDSIIEANKKDLEAFQKEDQALYDRLIVNDKKIDEMIAAVNAVMHQDDPVGQEDNESYNKKWFKYCKHHCSLWYHSYYI